MSLDPIPSDSVTMAVPLKLSTSILDTVLLSASIVLLVNVSVVALPTSVSDAVGNVTVPVLLILLMTGVVSVLFVSVCVPVSVATVLSIATVSVLPEPEVSIPVPPAMSKVSLSKSMLNAPPESP